MRRIIILAVLALLGVACKSAPEKGWSMYEDIEAAAEANEPGRVEELVKEMTIWYDGLSEKEKEEVDEHISKCKALKHKDSNPMELLPD